jgi:hypothetical protein
MLVLITIGDALGGKTQNPDDPGGGGSIATLLACAGMTAYGFWLRKRKLRKQNMSLQELNNASVQSKIISLAG